MKASYVLLILMTLIVLACEKKPVEEEVKENQWDIVNIEGSNSCLAGDTIQLLVYYPAASGCDILNRFENTINGNTYLVRAYGHTVNGMCIMNATIKSATYKFSTEIKGIYNLRFQRRDGSILLHTLKIN